MDNHKTRKGSCETCKHENSNDSFKYYSKCQIPYSGGCYQTNHREWEPKELVESEVEIKIDQYHVLDFDDGGYKKIESEGK